MKRLLITGVVLMSSSLFLLAQNDGDAIRFSQYFPMGTARSVAMGSAFGALGADFSALSINPAGIGVYRKSELTFTPDIYYDKTQSTFYSQNYTDFKYKFLFNNLGGVFAFNSNRDKGWVGAAIGVGYNRLADYNRNITISASNTQSSLLDEFVFYADGLDTSRLNSNYELLAWKTDLIYLPDNENMPWAYASDMNYYDFGQGQWVSNYGQTQERHIVTKGGIDEYSLTFGANYSHMLYIGMSLGLNRLLYDESKVHTEWDANNTIDYFQSFTFSEYFYTRGTGFTAKFGIIAKPVEMVRLGFSLHLPTFYNLESEFSTSMKSYFDAGNPSSMSARSGVTVTDYRVVTPLRMVFSGGLQFGKIGILSADYEMIDYTTAKIDGDLDNYDDINKNIQDYYKSAGNLRLGGELKLGNLALRAGYAHYGSPYASGQLNAKASQSILSTGFGVRSGSMFVDFAYAYAMRDFRHSMYYAGFEGENGVEYYSQLKQNTSRFMATIGFRF